MPGLVSQAQQVAFTSPANGETSDASEVLSNDNAVRAKHNTHDADATIHVQSSALASRPAAGEAQRLWVSTDGRRVYLDNGVAWEELAYLTTGGQVAFPAAQNASADANTLDDYEEADWTPTLGTALNCSALALTSARYTKIGRLVFVQLHGTFTVTASTTDTSFSFTLPVSQRSNTENSVGSARSGPALGVVVDTTGANATEASVYFPATGGIVSGAAQVWMASLTYHAAT